MTKTKTSKTRCQAKTKARKPCRARPMSGGLCFFHANPKMASDLGGRGGSTRKRQPASVELVAPLPTLDSKTALRELNQRMIKEVYSGRLDPYRARCTMSLLSLQAQLLEVNSFAAPDEPPAGATYIEAYEASWLRDKKRKWAEECEKKYADQFPKGDAEEHKANGK